MKKIEKKAIRIYGGLRELKPLVEAYEDSVIKEHNAWCGRKRAGRKLVETAIEYLPHLGIRIDGYEDFSEENFVLITDAYHRLAPEFGLEELDDEEGDLENVGF